MLRRLHDRGRGHRSGADRSIGRGIWRRGFAEQMARLACGAIVSRCGGLVGDLRFHALDQRRRSGDEPLGVVGIITPWNSNAGFICGKLAMAIAAGCTTVIKPSEMSALQTEIVLDALHAAGIPAGVCNLVQGSGEIVGAAIAAHPDIAKISFTGSTAVGKAILRSSAETMKRVTLELGGKSPMPDSGRRRFRASGPVRVDGGRDEQRPGLHRGHAHSGVGSAPRRIRRATPRRDGAGESRRSARSGNPDRSAGQP